MIRATLSYSKKVPADEQYSSQGYHLSLEQELPDNLRQEELRAQIHETYNLVRQIVDEELNGERQTKPVAKTRAESGGSDQASDSQKCSPNQARFIMDLSRDAGIEFNDLNAQVQEMYKVESVYLLSKKAASRLISDLQRNRRKAA